MFLVLFMAFLGKRSKPCATSGANCVLLFVILLAGAKCCAPFCATSGAKLCDHFCARGGWFCGCAGDGVVFWLGWGWSGVGVKFGVGVVGVVGWGGWFGCWGWGRVERWGG